MRASACAQTICVCDKVVWHFAQGKMNNKKPREKLTLKFVSKMKEYITVVGYGVKNGKDRLFSNVYLVNKFYIKREICVLW